MIRPQDRIPADQPGRGINSAGDVIRFAVGRTDGKASMDDLDAKVRETVEGISQRYAAQRPAPRPRLLPSRIEAASLPRDLGGERYALGVRGRDLQPMVVDFATDPLLGVYGDDHHGKSTFITNVVEQHRGRSPVPQRGDHHLLRPEATQRRGDSAAGRAQSGR